MADPDILPAGLFSFFAPSPANTAAGLTYPAMEARRKIALQMMANSRKGFPKNVGEGLTAIGDAIGERGQMNQLMQMEADYAKRAAATSQESIPSEFRTPAVPQRTSEDTTADRPAVAAYASEEPAAATMVSSDYRSAPAYLQASLDRLIEDPERRGYLGQLAGKEAQSPDEVSPTGAAGPFQFIRSTGQQYGLVGNGQDKRTDIDASILAANKLTDDNVKTLTSRLGRAPTPGEMALAHQQGAVTAANMISGTGNAPARNLAVNNVAPGADPGAAASKIMNYYAMPARDRVANAVAQQATARAVPPSNPTLPGSALPLSATAPAPGGPAADLPPEITQGFSATAPASAIPSAPPVSQPIRTAPPVQVAEAAARPSARMPQTTDVPPTDDERRGWALKAKANALQDPYLTRQADDLIANGAAQRKQQWDILVKDYQDKMLADREKEKFYREGGAAKLQQAQSEAALKTEEAELVRRTGKTPAQLYPELDKEKAAVDQITKAQASQQLARRAISEGVITGYGANFKINAAKAANFALKNGMSGDLAANTEIMSAALKAGLPQAIETINGVGGRVSDADVKIAQGIQGTDPELQMKTIKTIMDRAAEINNQRIGNYEDKIDKYLSGHPQELNYRTNARPVAPPDKLNMLLEDPDKVVNGLSLREHFDRAYGPGSAELEIARFKRSQTRRGG